MIIETDKFGKTWIAFAPTSDSREMVAVQDITSIWHESGSWLIRTRGGHVHFAPSKIARKVLVNLFDREGSSPFVEFMTEVSNES